MKILSVATHNERMFNIFVESCKRNKCELIILGRGKDWKGFGWRWDLILEYIESNDINPKEIIMITDAFDSVVVQNTKRIEETFLKFKSPMVFSCEPLSKHFQEISAYYRWRVFGPDPIINGGSYIGYAGAIKKFIQRIKYKHKTDDQRFLTSLYKMVHMTVDYEHKLFYHHCSWMKKEYIGKIPKTCVVTFPASGYTSNILSKLGYEYSQPKESWNECMMVFKRRAKHYTPFFWREILIIATVLLGLGIFPLILGIIV